MVDQTTPYCASRDLAAAAEEGLEAAAAAGEAGAVPEAVEVAAAVSC